MANFESVYAVVYENPNEFNHNDDDIRRELFGVYVTHEEAQRVLEELQHGNDNSEFYTIEEWKDDFVI